MYFDSNVVLSSYNKLLLMKIDHDATISFCIIRQSYYLILNNIFKMYVNEMSLTHCNYVLDPTQISLSGNSILS